MSRLTFEQVVGAAFGSHIRVIRTRNQQGRNRSALIELSDGRRVFIKRSGENTLETVQWEARFLEASRRNCFGTHRFVPVFLHYDETRGALITNALQDYLPFARFLERAGLGEALIPVAIAGALAKLHDRDNTALVEAAICPIPKRALPVTTYSVFTPERIVRGGGPDHLKFAGLMQQAAPAIAALRTKWEHTHIIHGDIKADNIMLPSCLRSDRPIILVDWELCGMGDPLWDVGTYLGQCVLSWLILMAQGERTVASVSALRRHVGHFLITYGHFARAGLDSSLRHICYAGLFLIQRAKVALDRRGSLSPLADWALKIGCHLLSNPEPAWQELFSHA